MTAPYALSPVQVDTLQVASVLPSDLRAQVLQRYAAEFGSAALADMFGQFIALANSVVEDNREAAELILITEGKLHPYTAEKVNLPTIAGALQGVALAAGIAPDRACAGCAFRLGTCANQSPVTTVDAADCRQPGEQPFMCHEDLDDRGEPTKACAGFAQARSALKKSRHTPNKPSRSS